MAKRRRGSNTPPPEEGIEGLEAGTNPLARIDDGLDAAGQRSSEDLIYESIMRSGGEPFGTPFEPGVGTLTDKIVKFFKQRSFFSFETWERNRPKRMRNRFTRHGASRFFGTYGAKEVVRARTEVTRTNVSAKPGEPKK